MGALFAWINKFFDGKKTTIGKIGAVATFIVVLTNALADGFQSADIQIVLAAFSAMMLAIGLGHKAEKILDALKK